MSVEPTTPRMTNYSQLDQAILERLGRGSASFTALRTALDSIVVAHAPVDGRPEDQFRVLDRRLQALRKAQRITYSRASGWSLA